MKRDSFGILFLFGLVYVPQFSLCETISVSCCNSHGEFRLNLIPHPTSCLAFYHCEPLLLSEGQYGTVPTLTFCPLDENGREQHYDFRECRCLRDYEAECFDATIRKDREDFFNCTLPFIVEGTNARCK